MPPLTFVQLQNYKLFEQKQDFELKPLTLLTGTNSSGKTSVIQALRLLSNYLSAGHYYPNSSVSFSLPLKLSLDQIGERLGDFSKLINYAGSDAGRKNIRFTIPCQLQGILERVSLTLTFNQSGQVLYEGVLAGLSLDTEGGSNLLSIQKVEGEWRVRINYWYLWQEFKRDNKYAPAYYNGLNILQQLRDVTTGTNRPEDWSEEKQSNALKLLQQMEQELQEDYRHYHLSASADVHTALIEGYIYRPFFVPPRESTSIPHSSFDDPFFDFVEKPLHISAEEKQKLAEVLDGFFEALAVSQKAAWDQLWPHRRYLEELNRFLSDYIMDRQLDKEEGEEKTVGFMRVYLQMLPSFTNFEWKEAHQLLLEQFCFSYKPAPQEEALPALFALIGEPYRIVKGKEKRVTFELPERLDVFLQWMERCVAVADEREEALALDFDEHNQPIPFFDEVFFRHFIRQNILEALQQMTATFSKIGFLSSIRNIVKRAYGNRREETEFNSHILEFLELGLERHSSLMAFINHFIQEFNIGEQVSVERDSEGASNRVYVLRGERKVLLADLGYGISQFLPILFKIAIQASRNFSAAEDRYAISTLCVEEPETNLHPALQSKLADLFTLASEQFNIQFIVETHSEYLVRKLQYLAVNGTIQSESVLVYYFEPLEGGEGAQPVRAIHLNNDGSLSGDFGAGFFDEADKIAISIWDMNQAQKN